MYITSMVKRGDSSVGAVIHGAAEKGISFKSSVRACSALVLALAWAGTASAQAPTKRIPLCAGLTVVTAVSQRDGDYESIKTVESVSEQAVRLKYSSERMVQEFLSNDPPKLQQTTVYRTIRVADLASAYSYLQFFYDKLPETIPGTTAIGTSSAVLTALKTKGEADIGIFIGFSFTGAASLDRSVHPNVFDNQMLAKIHRLETAPVMIPVIVNDVPVKLPAIHAAGDFYGDKTEFFFLDDLANPITLKYRFGIGAVPPNEGDNPQTSRDRDAFEVIKISYRCSDQQPLTTAEVPSSAGQMEQALAGTGKAEVYDLYFSFNSDRIREESEPRLKEIAEVLGHHPDWKLDVQGHTDNVGGESYNLPLSQRRAAAVKDALVARYRIEPARLSTAGYGASRPQDTNDTLEGRARNRRVELVRQ
jgi:outer membrane protein OmpA-like peptidoglycan-associated protein